MIKALVARRLNQADFFKTVKGDVWKKDYSITHKFMTDKSSKIYVAGHRGLVGSAIFNNLKEKGF